MLLIFESSFVFPGVQKQNAKKHMDKNESITKVLFISIKYLYWVIKFLTNIEPKTGMKTIGLKTFKYK